MKILVAVKRVVDHNVKIRIKPDNQSVDKDNVRMSMNPFCKHALEGAVQIKESGKADEVVVVCVGSKKASDVLLTALAMGADRAVLVQSEEELETLAIAKILQKIVEQEKPDLVLMGKQSVDIDASQTPQMLAGLLNWGQATFVCKIEVDGKKLNVTREVDYGLQELSLNLPAVISADLGLNKPRNVALPMVMRAKKKPLVILQVDEFKVDISPRLKTEKISAPPTRKGGKNITSIDELVDEIKTISDKLEMVK
jgi:electron transfer flavoprotein beta subunit